MVCEDCPHSLRFTGYLILFDSLKQKVPSLMKTRQPFHPNQPFQLPHLHKATTHKPHRLHLLREVYPLLIQVVAVLLFLSKTRSREGGPTFVLWGRSREAAYTAK